ncbi:MAG: hypothetical protein JSW48_09505 [Betaproteobacteria bacterium]|nr:MAG: hypothetical protein JSW48_09505 [Betaproteobacteria bacterium]
MLDTRAQIIRSTAKQAVERYGAVPRATWLAINGNVPKGGLVVAPDAGNCLNWSREIPGPSY